jgi:hypothetical protein
MLLSPRRLLAIGFVETAVGTAVYYGISVVGTFWAMRALTSSEFVEPSSMFSSVESVGRIMNLALYIGGPVVLIGVVTSLVGVVS